MNEVEKLYSLTGIEKFPFCCDKNCGEPTKKCKDCPDYCEIYPPFTAEKQLELIKWLGHRRHIDIDIYNIKGYTIYDISNDYDCIMDEHKFMFDSNTFEDALAGLINQVWHSLTEEERKQIKEILS